MKLCIYYGFTTHRNMMNKIDVKPGLERTLRLPSNEVMNKTRKPKGL